MNRVTIGSAILAAALSFSGYAQSAPPVAGGVGMPAPKGQMTAKRGASNVLEEGITSLNLFIASGKARDVKALTKFVDLKIKPYFDFDHMAKLVAGPFYETMSTKEKALFTKRVEKMFMRAFIDNVVSHRGPPPKVQFLRPRPSSDARRIDLMARLLFPGGATKRMVFKFSKSNDGKWKVFDVVANGQSAVLYYRKHFMQVARKGGVKAMVGR